ncbi:MAG: tetratricopeptide repeat protein, partial [Candidatus Acidiferrales bacterium]
MITIVVCYASGRIWLADARVHSQDVAVIERGVSLEPGNGDAWDRLGRYHQWDFANPDTNRAIGDFSRAVRDDPHSAHFLMDLAGAYEAAGDTSRAQQTWNRARSVYPASAEVDWN